MFLLRRIAPALATASLVACSAPPSPDASPGDVVTATDATDTTPDVPPAGPCTLPAGYTLTPFLTDTASYYFSMADMVLAPSRDYIAVLETDAGRIVFDLFEDQTPITVNSFVFLARNHYFDGIAFHRVLDGFVAQGGDPNTLDDTARSTWGTGGPGYTFGVEIVSTLHYDMAGVVGMARTSDPNSNGSQFFITLAATPSLDGQYTIFARVIDGLAVLPNIARNQSMSVPPLYPTRMQHVCIAERAR